MHPLFCNVVNITILNYVKDLVNRINSLLGKHKWENSLRIEK